MNGFSSKNERPSSQDQCYLAWLLGVLLESYFPSFAISTPKTHVGPNMLLKTPRSRMPRNCSATTAAYDQVNDSRAVAERHV